MTRLVNGVILPDATCPSCGWVYDEEGPCIICGRCSHCCCCLGPERFVDDVSREAFERKRGPLCENCGRYIAVGEWYGLHVCADCFEWLKKGERSVRSIES